MAEPQERPVISFVAIHGIGRQGRGETAEAVASALKLACLEAEISFDEIEGSTFDGEPEVSARVSSPDGAAAVVNFVDAWWDDKVEPPPTKPILQWMLRITPFITFFTISSWIGDLSEFSDTFRLKGLRAAELLAFPFMLVSLILSPVLMIVLVVLNVVSNFRPQAWPRVAELVQSVFGDAWLYRSEELDDFVIPHLRKIVERAKESSDYVILVGHSQGAEIGRRLALTIPVDCCVWVGGADSHLAIARTLRRSPVLPYLLWAYVLISPFLVSLVIYAVVSVTLSFLAEIFETVHLTLEAARVGASALRVADVDPWSFMLRSMADLPWLVAFVIFITVVAIILRKAARPPEDVGKSPDCSVIEVNSLADPVCFGRSSADSFVRYVPVRQGTAVLREHVTYFEKSETGRALLEPVFSLKRLPKPFVPKFGFLTQTVAFLSSCLLIACSYALGNVIFAKLSLFF